MTTLHDRLTTLAERVDDGTRPSADELWASGQRLHRRRRAGTAAIVGACVLALLGLGLLDHHRSSVQPASGRSGLAIPDHIHEPSKWLPGTEGEPWDRSIAVIHAERGGWFGSTQDWVGVSAETGEYRFLDLPDRAAQEGGEVALSPDGRYVAYWVTGTVPDPPPDTTDPVVGYAVYDLEAGEVVLREDVPSDEGLMVEDLQWLDASVVVVPFLQVAWQGEGLGAVGNRPEVLLRDVRGERSTRWPAREIDSAGHGWTVTWRRPSRARSAERPEQVVRLRGGSSVPPLADPSGTRFASLQPIKRKNGTQHTPAPLSVAELRPGADQARFIRVPGSRRYLGMLGWQDERTVVVRRWIPESDPAVAPDMGVFAVDIHTGREKRVGVAETQTAFAAGLLDLPVVERPTPPTPLGPWTRLTVGVAVLVLGSWGVLVWRRRVGP